MAFLNDVATGDGQFHADHQADAAYFPDNRMAVFEPLQYAGEIFAHGHGMV